MSALTDEIRSRGHWSVRIHPARFNPKRVADYGSLRSIISRTAVRLRGWDFPHIGDFHDLKHGLDWIGQETDWQYYREAWRLYQTGQFAYLGAIHEDWAERATHGWGPPASLAEHGRLLGVGDTLFRFTEIFEFSARLALTEAGDDLMAVVIELKGLNDRSLWVDNPYRAPMDRWYTAHFDAFPYKSEVSRDRLSAEARELAVTAARDLFERFGWKPSPELLRSQQAEGSRFASS